MEKLALCHATFGPACRISHGHNLAQTLSDGLFFEVLVAHKNLSLSYLTTILPNSFPLYELPKSYLSYPKTIINYTLKTTIPYNSKRVLARHPNPPK